MYVCSEQAYEWLFGNLNNLWTMRLVRVKSTKEEGRLPREMMLPPVFIVVRTHAPNN